MNASNSVQDTATRPLSPEVIGIILFVSLVVIGVFAFAMSAFMKAGQKDSEWRRRRGAEAKDPLDPNLPSQRD